MRIILIIGLLFSASGCSLSQLAGFLTRSPGISASVGNTVQAGDRQTNKANKGQIAQKSINNTKIWGKTIKITHSQLSKFITLLLCIISFTIGLLLYPPQFIIRRRDKIRHYIGAEND